MGPRVGRLLPDNLWQATAYTVARAAQRGYALTQIEQLLVRTTGNPLGAARQAQLLDWYQRHDAYQLRPVFLLSTKRPDQMDFVFQQQRWRRHVGARVAARHAVVSPGLIPLLERALAGKDIPLMAAAPSASDQQARLTDVDSCWLALSIVQRLGRLIELPFLLPTDTLQQLSSQLSAEQQAALAQLAEQTAEGINAAIQGRDAYFLPERPVEPAVVQTICEAIAAEQMLRLAYQALGEPVPRQRDVEPFWLEERAGGQYASKAAKLADWLETNIPEGLTVFSFPDTHRRLIRTTNSLERLNREIRRRSRVATLFPNEASCLRLVTAVVMEISDEWQTGRTYIRLDNL